MWKKIMHWMMFSCEQAAALVSASFDRKLRSGEQIKLKMHLGMCKHCSRYSHQAEVLHHSLQHFIEYSSLHTAYKMSDNQKERIQKELDKHLF